MLLHSELSKSTFATSTKLQWMTTLMPEVLVMVTFQTLSVSEGRAVGKFRQDTQYQSAYCGGEDRLSMNPPTAAPEEV